MSIQSRSGLAAVALASLLAACGSPDAPEPEGETTAEVMPETPDLSETAADEAAVAAGAPPVAPPTTAPDAGPVTSPATEKQAPAPAY